MEVNATAGAQTPLSYTFTMTARDSHLRVNSGPRRVATVTNIDGGTLRHATVDHEGAHGRFLTLAPGASKALGADDPSRVFISDGVPTTVQVAVTDG